MNIQIDPHTLERAKERGSNQEEIVDVVESGFFIPAKHNRKGKAKIYEFHNQRGGRFYEEKRVEVYYLETDNKIITVTVYVFYGRWES